MKVLFVGEGNHDVGPAQGGHGPRPARGVVPALVRRICPAIGEDSIALAWREIVRFSNRRHTGTVKKGFAAKIRAAAMLSESGWGCAGTVCVTDQDGQQERLQAMKEGAEHVRGVVNPAHQVVCGVAVQSIEAWTLADPDALAQELGAQASDVCRNYPPGSVEALSQNSGKPERRSKDLIQTIAQLKGRHDCTEFREAVAERANVATIEKNCPGGFAPFAKAIRAAFGHQPIADE